jgi:hypothetical protein
MRILVSAVPGPRILRGRIHRLGYTSSFLKLTGQGHRLSPKPCATYAAKRVAEHPDAKGYTKQKMAEAMQRLLDAGELRVETNGPPSRRYDVLVASAN